MDPLVPHESTILPDAFDRAERLLELLMQQGGEFGVVARPVDLESYPDFPSPGLLAEGEALLQDATESTRLLADGLAAAASAERSGGRQPPPPRA